MSADDRLSPEIIRVAVVAIVGAVMSILDTSIVNVALQSLSRDLHAPLSTIQWVASGYLLALASVIPLTGWAAERFGPRRSRRSRWCRRSCWRTPSAPRRPEAAGAPAPVPTVG